MIGRIFRVRGLVYFGPQLTMQFHPRPSVCSSFAYCKHVLQPLKYERILLNVTVDHNILFNVHHQVYDRKFIRTSVIRGCLWVFMVQQLICMDGSVSWCLSKFVGTQPVCTVKVLWITIHFTGYQVYQTEGHFLANQKIRASKPFSLDVILYILFTIERCTKNALH